MYRVANPRRELAPCFILPLPSASWGVFGCAEPPSTAALGSNVPSAMTSNRSPSAVRRSPCLASADCRLQPFGAFLPKPACLLRGKDIRGGPLAGKQNSRHISMAVVSLESLRTGRFQNQCSSFGDLQAYRLRGVGRAILRDSENVDRKSDPIAWFTSGRLLDRPPCLFRGEPVRTGFCSLPRARPAQRARGTRVGFYRSILRVSKVWVYRESCG